jgi:hypothetical protein
MLARVCERLSYVNMSTWTSPSHGVVRRQTLLYVGAEALAAIELAHDFEPA